MQKAPALQILEEGPGGPDASRPPRRALPAEAGGLRGQEVRVHPEGRREAGRDRGGEEALLQDQGHVQALDRLVEGQLDGLDGEGCNEGCGREGGDLEAPDRLARGGCDLAIWLLCAAGTRDE